MDDTSRFLFYSMAANLCEVQVIFVSFHIKFHSNRLYQIPITLISKFKGQLWMFFSSVIHSDFLLY